MPADPEPPPGASPAVEAMLQDAARRRREAFDAAGPGASAMPGPMRTRLHAELARQFNEATPSGGPVGDWRRLTTRWWPALASAVGVAAAMAVFLVAGHQRPTAPSVVADAGPRPAAMTTPGAAEPAPPAAVPPPSVPAPKETVAETSGTLAQVTPTSVPESVRTQTFTRGPLPLATALRAAAPPVAASPRRREAAAASASAPAGGSGTTPTPTPLLGNFRFEQQGGNVRVVDADGSVYVGYVQPEGSDKADAAKQVSPAGTAQKQAPAAKSERQVEAGENFRFRATGDNRTLHQTVVFEGEYSSVQTSQKPQTPATKQAPAAADAPPAPAQIRGRLRVLDGRDDQRGAEVEARSVGPAAPR